MSLPRVLPAISFLAPRGLCVECFIGLSLFARFFSGLDRLSLLFVRVFFSFFLVCYWMCIFPFLRYDPFPSFVPPRPIVVSGEQPEKQPLETEESKKSCGCKKEAAARTAAGDAKPPDSSRTAAGQPRGADHKVFFSHPFFFWLCVISLRSMEVPVSFRIG